MQDFDVGKINTQLHLQTAPCVVQSHIHAKFPKQMCLQGQFIVYIFF